MYDQEASPEKFLAYIKNAECVFTSSFHGTALSLVFEKTFYTIKQNNSSDLSMSSLLEQLGLLDRFIEMSKKPNIITINYKEVMEKLSMLRQESEKFLLMALKNE